MKRIFFIIFLILLLSCSTSDRLKTLRYDPWKSGWKLYIDVPRKYTLVKILEEEACYVLNYNNGIKLYIGETTSSLNYENIRKLGDSIFNFRFHNNEIILEINKMAGREIQKAWPDTLVLSGIDKNGLYWKDILLYKQRINLGYINVSKEKKDIFDKSLNSFRKGRKGLEIPE